MNSNLRKNEYIGIVKLFKKPNFRKDEQEIISKMFEIDPQFC